MALLVVWLWVAVFSTPYGNAPPLLETLDAIDEVCRHYSTQALRFTADEKIVLRRGRNSDTHRFRHIYVVDESGRHDEMRVPVRKRHDPEAVAATSAYGWIFLFEAGRRDFVEYSWVGREQRLERDAVGIAFAPRGEILPEVNDWYGVAWFDVETHLPLVVEAWTPAEHERKLAFEKSLAQAARKKGRSREVHVVTSVRAEFREQRNALRLPTRVTLREARFIVWGKNGTSGYRDETLATVKQFYTNYRFYDVGTEEPEFAVADSDQGSRNN